MSSTYTQDEKIVDSPDEIPTPNLLLQDKDKTEVSVNIIPDKSYQVISVDDKTYEYLQQIEAVEPEPEPDYGTPSLIKLGFLETKAELQIFGSNLNFNINWGGHGLSYFNPPNTYGFYFQRFGPHTIQIINAFGISKITASGGFVSFQSLNVDLTEVNFANNSFGLVFGPLFVPIETYNLKNIDLSNNRINNSQAEEIIDEIYSSFIFGGTLKILQQKFEFLSPSNTSLLISRGWTIV